MLNQNLIQTLNQIGLSENESKVYLSALSLGPSTVLQISKEANIKRTTVYTVIESLQQKGLISIKIVGFKKEYVAESPKGLERIIEERRNKFKDQLPEFLSLFNQEGDQGVLKYYEGPESLKGVYESMIQDIKSGEDYLIVSQGKEVFDTFGEWFESFAEERSKLDINIRLLMKDTEWTRNYKKHDNSLNQTTKFLPKETDLTTNLVITPKRVLIQQLVSPTIGIVIENKSVILMFQQMFTVMWNSISDL